LESARGTEMRMSPAYRAAVAAAMATTMTTPKATAATTRIGGRGCHHCDGENNGDARSNELSPLRSHDFRQDTLPFLKKMV
jgi:hypothetical protein